MFMITLLRLSIVGLICVSSSHAYSEDKPVETIELDDVTVTADSNQPTLEQKQGFNVTEIDAAEFFNFNQNLSQILNTQPGIITRQKGAMGADTELSINGLSGRQIRYFLDGIPMESFGSALDLNDIPINVVTGIRVYKGVVPITLSSDALGGAIDIHTPSINETFLDGAISYGSFNTTQASINAQTTSADEAYFLRLSAFYNHSDNDYIMRNAPDLDALGNLKGTKPRRRFHNRYTSHMVSLKAGITSRHWTDELSFSVTHAGNHKQEQHPGVTINQVLGKYHSKNDTLLYSSTYRLDRESISLKAYVLGGKTEETFNDSASRRYRWDGSYTPKESILGELGQKSIFTLKDELFRANITGRYRLTSDTNFGASINFNSISRSGSDALIPDSPLYPKPNEAKKMVFAMDYGQSWFDNALISTLFVKQYAYRAAIVSTEVVNFEYEATTTDVNLDETGYGVALQYNVSNSTTAKLSFEKTYRIPEPDEVMGNGQFVLPSPKLNAEQSNNFNLGLLHKNQYGSIFTQLESNVFYRNSTDFIYFVPTQVVRGKYLNISDVNVIGTELSTLFDYQNTYHLKTSITYQSITDQSELESDGTKNFNYKSKIPNTPYLFANSRLGWSHYTRNYNKISIYFNTNYVYQYYLNWENLGDKKTKNIIPTQITHNLELEYVLSNIDISSTLTITNITDGMVFDNFNIQKPGRAYYLKLRYSY